MSRPFRFTFILVLAALATGLAAVGGWRYARASAPVNGPIILISVDTLRADHLPAYGYTAVRTPAIDALAADGVVFELAYSHAPQTLPAHASMLSGRLPFETGVRDNVGFTVKAGERLLPQMLRERGYSTGGIVSAYVLRRDTGIGQGFDFFDGDMPPDADELTVGPLQRDGAASVAIAERWLNAQRSERVFLFLHLYEPHKPYAPPDRFSSYTPYDGEIAYADEVVGRLVQYLKTHQLYDRSTIVLVSDHGEGLGDHGEQEHGLFVYDETIHVPLIIKQAGGEGAGRRVTEIAQHLDLVPTILDLVKAPIPGNLRGRSLKPVLDATGNGVHLAEQPVYSEALYGRYHFGWSELIALTEARYRYIKAPDEELYDLQRDPQERENLSGDRTQARQALRATLDRLIAGTTVHTPGNVSADARERLQALGYVGSATAVPTEPGEALPDPKDKWQILETYRAAIDRAGEGKWPQAIGLLQQIVRDDPGIADVWNQLATFAGRLDRLDLAVEAYNRYIELKPSDPGAYLAAAGILVRQRKPDEAREQAALAIQLAPERDGQSRAAAHEILATIAIARHDLDGAREEARLAHEADPTLPLPAYIEGRILYDQGQYEEALTFFQQAIAGRQKSTGTPVRDLHYYAGETLVRLERYPEAETQLTAEVRDFAQNVRARAALATIYHATGRPEAAERTIADMIRVSPTPEAYTTAARLWTTFGNRRQADAVRAEARRTFAEARTPARRTRH